MEHTDSEAHSDEEAAKVIAFDDLSRDDQVSVQTARSNYHFSVLDAHNRTGMLTGGFLGDQAIEAVFTGTLTEDDGNFDSRELKTGARAVFFVHAKNQVQRVITSVITNLGVSRVCVGGNRAA